MNFLLRYRYWIIVLAVLLPRFLWFGILGRGLPSPARDQGLYLDVTGRIMDGEGLSYGREMGWLRSTMVREGAEVTEWSSDPGHMFGIIPVETPTASLEPGYPLLLALVFSLTGPTTGGVFLLNSILALAGALAVMALTGENWGERQGLLAGVIWSLYPYYIYYSGYAMTDMAHIAMLPVVLLFTVRAMDDRVLSGALAGLSAAVLFLIRSTVLFLVPFQALWLLLGKKWKSAVSLVLVFLVCCIPWMERNSTRLGSPVLLPTKGSLNLWMRNNPELLELEGIPVPDALVQGLNRKDLLEYPSLEDVHGELARSDVLTDRARDFILANPLYFAYLTGLRAVLFLTPFGSTLDHPAARLAGLIVYLPLLVMAFLALLKRRKDRRIMLLFWTFMVYLGLHALAHGGVRYRLPVDMVLMVLASLYIGRRAGWTEKAT